MEPGEPGRVAVRELRRGSCVGSASRDMRTSRFTSSVRSGRFGHPTTTARNSSIRFTPGSPGSPAIAHLAFRWGTCRRRSASAGRKWPSVPERAARRAAAPDGSYGARCYSRVDADRRASTASNRSPEPPSGRRSMSFRSRSGGSRRTSPCTRSSATTATSSSGTTLSCTSPATLPTG